VISAYFASFSAMLKIFSDNIHLIKLGRNRTSDGKATGVAQLYEVWVQLRNRAGKRQVPNSNLRIGAAHNFGGTGGTSTFTILERR